MSEHDREKLRSIRTFPQLIKYLRDELDWPIDADDFDDLTFDYEPDELGIDAKTAAKIDYVKQLRPLEEGQPWGIFFVKFEPKRLPVVAMRRILRGLAVQKRVSADRAERAAWAKSDLLFISAYGEDDKRHISFAHFHEDTNNGDLPILRVLGWDGSDTALHIDHTHSTLTSKLRWPAIPTDTDSWRQTWSGAFTLAHREVITTSKQMAIRLADLAAGIRRKINTILAVEKKDGPLHTLMKAFREALIHDMDEDDFADTYAQTVAYGLLTARISRPEGLTADNLTDMVPITNPFLKELMETFLHLGGRQQKFDFDELGINDVVEALRNANMEAVLRDFGDRNPAEDPVIHFYELFLKEYDTNKRMKRGVFYTPRPVVSYIVRSVHELLQTQFGLTDGLADTTTWGEMAVKHKDLEIPKGTDPNSPFVLILDPACGTGTFLVEVIDVIHKHMKMKWQKEGHLPLEYQSLWNKYVSEHLLPRLHGYELLMAPYAIAHMKIGLKLFETGYKFASEERAHIYLTNALEAPHDFSDTFEQMAPALAHEAAQVNDIKRDMQFTVVMGNPPYLGEAGTGGDWIAGLMRGRDILTSRKSGNYFEVAGQPLNERNPKWINDDYVKFTRLSQWLIERTGCGIHGFISNHGYLDNPTFRGMRWSLMSTFHIIHALDLHGNVKKKEMAPDGGKDVNVFDIEQGVAIGLFVRAHLGSHDVTEARVQHADLWGERCDKYDWLLNRNVLQTAWTQVDAIGPFFLFEPFENRNAGGYFKWHAINQVMPTNSVGIVTSRDSFVTDYDRSTLTKRIADFVSSTATDAAIRQKYLSGKDKLSVQEARSALRKEKNLKANVQPLLYRPFDRRWVFYHKAVIERSRLEAMPHLLAGYNIAIITARSNKFPDPDHFFASRTIVETKCGESSTQSATFPLYLYPGIGKSDGALFCAWPKGKDGRRPNVDPDFVQTLERSAGMSFKSDGRGDLDDTFGPEDVLAYIYTVFHSPEYRRRFEPMLKLDFPRVPIPASSRPLADLVQIGHDLLGLHLLESPRLDKSITKLIGPVNPKVEKVSYTADDQTVWLDKAQTRGFVGVPEEVWNFHIGGYQVCEKWLKDRQAKGGKNPRPGRILTDEDIDHYQKIVVAINETIKIMKQIDETIESHGGWPEAFGH